MIACPGQLWLSTSSKIEEVESAVGTFLEVLSWMDWWLYAARSVVLGRCKGEAKCYRLFVGGVWTQMIMGRTASILLVSSVLMRVGMQCWLRWRLTWLTKPRWSWGMLLCSFNEAITFEKRPLQLPAKQRQPFSPGSRLMSSFAKWSDPSRPSKAPWNRKGTSLKTSS